MHREITQLLQAAPQNTINFQSVVDVIRRHYECCGTAFTTGAGTARETNNPATANQASCHLLAFARRLQLDEPTTLSLYAEHYRAVLADPDGSAHANIRAFMFNGWPGVCFAEDPLRLRGPG